MHCHWSALDISVPKLIFSLSSSFLVLAVRVLNLAWKMSTKDFSVESLLQKSSRMGRLTDEQKYFKVSFAFTNSTLVSVFGLQAVFIASK